MHYTKPELVYRPLGALPLVQRRTELRVFLERTPVRARLALWAYYQRADGEWRRDYGLQLPAASIPHLIRLLEHSVELLPQLPPPPAGTGS